jgi:hypothetical protein
VTDRFWRIVLQKSFWGDERKFLEPLVRFASGDLGAISFHPKSITDLASGAEKRRNSRKIRRSTFARFLGLFDFRLLQQYPPIPDSLARSKPQHESTLAHD